MLALYVMFFFNSMLHPTRSHPQMILLFFIIPPLHRWYEWVDRYSLDREVVNVAYHFHHIHLTHEIRVKDLRNHTEHETRAISVAALMIAIKVRYPRMYEVVEEETIACTMVRELCSDAIDEPGLLRLGHYMINTSLVGRLHDVPTMLQFAVILCKLHPVLNVQPSLLDYLFSVTRFQVENALMLYGWFHPHKPSTVAFAALARQLDENSYEYEKYIEEICPIIGADEREVVNIIFVLENNIPELPRSEEFEAILASSLAARRAERGRSFDDDNDDDDDDDNNDYYYYAYEDDDTHRPESPSCVDGV